MSDFLHKWNDLNICEECLLSIEDSLSQGKEGVCFGSHEKQVQDILKARQALLDWDKKNGPK
jgi:hypothetical protein